MGEEQAGTPIRSQRKIRLPLLPGYSPTPLLLVAQSEKGRQPSAGFDASHVMGRFPELTPPHLHLAKPYTYVREPLIEAVAALCWEIEGGARVPE